MTKSTDEAIRAAMERGEFDNLLNKGKKLNWMIISIPRKCSVWIFGIEKRRFRPKKFNYSKRSGIAGKAGQGQR